MRGWQRGGGSILVLLLAAIAFSLVPAVPAQAQGGTEPSFNFQLGPLWYLRGDSVYDTISMVEGGVEGSAALLLQGVGEPDAFESDWFFVEGERMFFIWDPLEGPQGAGMQISEKGRTTRDLPDQVAIEWANRKILSGYLADVYLAKKGQPEESRHMPFLTGNGWASPGAKKEDALYLLQNLLNLTNVNVKEDAGGSGSVWRVNSQDPAGGVLIPDPATKVMIHVIQTDGKSVPLSFAGQTVGGDTPSDAPVVTLSRKTPVRLLLDIGTASSDFRDVPSPDDPKEELSSDAKDSFWEIKIADEEGPRIVTLRSVLPYPRVALGAWTRSPAGDAVLVDKGAAVGYGAKIRFEVPQAKDGPCYIQAEFPASKFGELSLEIVLE